MTDKKQAAQSAVSPAPVAPISPNTTALVAAALRRNEVEGGQEYARAELIAALAGCLLYSLELDGLTKTLALLADAAVVLEKGYSSPVAPTLH